ncbi:uncharacterized protein MYCFIDRAFT_195928 [Pseudocercospora fijiensis CIRAD86]|uniref:Uncharacterized protein n=1 Tax=Pseudocercospora fijiensis (strain CIRAD86) TaxID=383855 RepID=M3A1J4_PSEFD|nr:uncharacterized protein MYCFIDRAFT_195928 [Pseudocercospora fijiensis CIRAD86]EME85054.1 hypothetical protein MYCFIDRAFT_195928 [Pseudocercospora fijiensis CIRAD86]
MCKSFHNLYTCGHASKPQIDFCPLSTPSRSTRAHFESRQPCDLINKQPMEGRRKEYCCKPACCEKKVAEVKLKSDLVKRKLEKQKGSKRKSQDLGEMKKLEEEFERRAREWISEKGVHGGCRERRNGDDE